MKKIIFILLGLSVSFCFGFMLNPVNTEQMNKGADTKEAKIVNKTKKSKKMKVGAFSVSLSVKDLKISKEFYENLGFECYAGTMESNYLIMKNGNALIGLFQGMFQGNILTFNPGWDENAKNLDKFEDVREIQKLLKSKDITLSSEADESTTGPASIMLSDPDGNVILFDQHR